MVILLQLLCPVTCNNPKISDHEGFLRVQQNSSSTSVAQKNYLKKNRFDEIVKLEQQSQTLHFVTAEQGIEEDICCLAIERF